MIGKGSFQLLREQDAAETLYCKHRGSLRERDRDPTPDLPQGPARKRSHEQSCWKSKPAPLPISSHQVIASPNYTISASKGNYRTEAYNHTASAVISGGKRRSETRLGRQHWEGNHLQKARDGNNTAALHTGLHTHVC